MFGDIESMAHGGTPPTVYPSPKVRKLPNVFVQTTVFLRRACTLQYRYVATLLLDSALVLLAGGVLGSMFSDVDIQSLGAVNSMSGLAVGLTSMLAALRAFGNDRPVFWREAASGVNRLSFFLGVNIAYLPILVLMPLIYLSLFYTFTAPRAALSVHYTVVLMTMWATSGLGYLISMIFQPRNAQMAAVVVGLISTMVSGSSPTLPKLDKVKVIGPFFYSISYCRWFVQALFEKEADAYPQVWKVTVAGIQSHYGYKDNQYAACVLVLMGFGFVTRILAFACMCLLNRAKQK
jgi:hypothetical protein